MSVLLKMQLHTNTKWSPLIKSIRKAYGRCNCYVFGEYLHDACRSGSCGKLNYDVSRLRDECIYICIIYSKEIMYNMLKDKLQNCSINQFE